MMEGQAILIDNVKVRGKWEPVYFFPSDSYLELIKGFNLLMSRREYYFCFLKEIGVIGGARTSETNIKTATKFLMRRINQLLYGHPVKSETRNGYILRVWFDEDHREILWILYRINGRLVKTNISVKDKRVEFVIGKSMRTIGTRDTQKRDETFGYCVIGEQEVHE